MTNFDHKIEDPRELGPDPTEPAWKTIGGHLFPANRVAGCIWEPAIFHRSVGPEIVAVAKSRIEGKWRAYIATTTEANHDNAIEATINWGIPVDEKLARGLFPVEFTEVPYAS